MTRSKCFLTSFFFSFNWERGIKVLWVDLEEEWDAAVSKHSTANQGNCLKNFGYLTGMS